MAKYIGKLAKREATKVKIICGPIIDFIGADLNVSLIKKEKIKIIEITVAAAAP